MLPYIETQFIMNKCECVGTHAAIGSKSGFFTHSILYASISIQILNGPVGTHDAIGSKLGFLIIKWISKL